MGSPSDRARVPPTGHPVRRAVSVLLLALVGSTASLAQTNVTVSGTVFDAASDVPLPFATVLVDSTALGAAANVDGHFALVGVPAGRHTLVVSYIGYVTERVAVHTDTLAGRPIRIRLAPTSGTLDAVTVTANGDLMRSNETASLITLSPRELAALPSVGEVDVFRSLQLLPGISGTNEGSSGLYVRGGTPDQNLVLLDGMTMYHVDHFFGFFSAFNADAIQDVQIYKGGFPATYGGRTSSVVDLTGRTGGSTRGLGVNVNLLSAGAVAEVPLGDRVSLLVSGRRSYTDVLKTPLYTGIFDTLTDAEPAPDLPAGRGGAGGGALGARSTGPGQVSVQPDFYFYDANAKLNIRPTDADVIALSLYNGQDHLDESRLTATSVTRGDAVGATLLNNVADVTAWGNLGASAKWSRQWAPRFYSNALVAYSRYFSENDRASLVERFEAETDSLLLSRSTSTFEDNRLDDFTVRLDNEWQAARTHTIGFGGQFTQSDVRYLNVRDDSLTVLDRDQASQLAAAYVQDTWRPVAPLRVVAGLRAAAYDATDQVVLEPRLSASLDVTDRFRLKGAYGEYHQYVARVVNESVTEGARDFWLLADGETVGVQGSTHYVLGASYETPTWLLDVEAYRKDLRGLSEFTLRFNPSGSVFEADDLFFDGTGVARGVEVLLQRTAGRFTGWAGYTLSQVEHTFDGLNGGLPFPALHDQTHELKLVGVARLSDRWTASATWAAATGRPYTAPESVYTLTLLDGTEQSYIHVGEKNGERLPAYHRLDASLHYRFPVGGSDVDLGLSVFNLYNRTNVWYREYDLSESPFVTTDVTFLGLTPNLSLRVDL
ncbi:MAG: TonB-dependent receptor [Rubricoccaceae bacterium]